ncbi:RICIN domain-containing protein [uncultured Olegusella sp.]|uniref:RICIN domain-containing protein n=1 Tax=uncultured Olegusella sp. TaxID=1979846 RepID=UPI0026251CA9|nr:RICIN domain-containing protein [uncultured Olegusella sp.]
MVNDGNYVFMLGANNGFALDVAGASDAHGKNVQVWTKHGRDSQIVHIATVDDHEELSFPATGKALDVERGKFVSGTNVSQWDWHGGANQQWQIEEVEGGIVVHPLAAPTLALTAENVGKGNVFLSSYVMGDTKQIWKLEAKSAAPAGVYELLSKVNSNFALDLTGGSVSAGAKVQTYLRNDTNAQKLLVTDTDGGNCRLKFCHSGRYLEVDKVAKGGIARQYANDTNKAGRPNLWVLVPRGIAEVNGVRATTYEVRNVAAQGATMCLDIYGGKTSNGSRVQLWPQNNSAAQEFILMPSEAINASVLPTPAAVGVVVGEDKYQEGTCVVGDAYPTFECEGKDFKARYRIRTREANSNWSDWGAWRHASDGSSANSGWGVAGVPSASFTDASTTKVLSTALDLPHLTADATDALELQLEVRYFVANMDGVEGFNVHSASGTSGTIRMTLQPTIAPVSVAATKDGLLVTYEGSYRHGGATVRVSDIVLGGKSILLESVSETGKDGSSGTVLVPWLKLADAPKAGARLDVHLAIDADGLTTEGAVGLIVTNTGVRRDLNVSVAETDHATLALEVPTISKQDKVSAVVHADNTIKMTTTATTPTKRTLDAFVPLGKTSTALVSVLSSDGSWGVAHVELPAISSHAYVWDWDGGHAALDLGLGSPASMEDTITSDIQDYKTTGRMFPAYRQLGTFERDLSVSGVLIHDKPEHVSIEALRALVKAGHAVFRTWRGEVATVAITGLKEPAQYRLYTQVEVTQYQETR